jgi:hypothetical protein
MVGSSLPHQLLAPYFLPPSFMATAQDANQQAVEPTGDQQQVDEVNPDQGDSQVDYEQRYAALKTDYDKLVSERKKKPEQEPPKATEKSVSKDGDLEWLIFNADRIKLCKSEFDDLRKEGLTTQKALEYAELKKGISKSTSASTREASVPPSTDTITRDDDTPTELTDWDRMLGVKPETKKKYKSFVEGR